MENDEVIEGEQPEAEAIIEDEIETLEPQAEPVSYEDRWKAFDEDEAALRAIEEELIGKRNSITQSINPARDAVSRNVLGRKIEDAEHERNQDAVQKLQAELAAIEDADRKNNESLEEIDFQLQELQADRAASAAEAFRRALPLAAKRYREIVSQAVTECEAIMNDLKTFSAAHEIKFSPSTANYMIRICRTAQYVAPELRSRYKDLRERMDNEWF